MLLNPQVLLQQDRIHDPSFLRISKLSMANLSVLHVWHQRPQNLKQSPLLIFLLLTGRHLHYETCNLKAITME